MTEDEWREFVSHGTRTGKLATVRADGSAHVVPVWFVLDKVDVVFNTESDSLKARNLRRDARAAMCIDDERFPYAFVALRGTATLSSDIEEMKHWATAIANRYVGAELAASYGARNAMAGELLVRLHIDHVTATADMAG